MTVETESLIHRLESGRLRPKTSYEMSTGWSPALTGRLRASIATLTQDVWRLEQRVTGGHVGIAEAFLEEMFRARHGLLVVETIASLSREVYARMAKIGAFGRGQGRYLIEDNEDQFERLRAMAHGQKDYLVGTIEFYQARTNTKMTIAKGLVVITRRSKSRTGPEPNGSSPGPLRRQRRRPTYRGAGSSSSSARYLEYEA